MSITCKPYGLLSGGEEAKLFRLEAGPFSSTISDYGAHLLSVFLPDGKGGKVDVLLGPASLGGLLANRPFFGATVGRFAGRISEARFSLHGTEYQLEANDGPNHIHGGIKGFDKRLWLAEAFEERGRPTLRLSLVSPEGEEGYPGRLEVTLTYSLSDSGELQIAFKARSSASTILNLTNHAYFNLKGEGRGDILDHRLKLACSRFLPAGEDLVPTGEIAQVAGGPFDFRSGKRIGAEIGAVSGGSAGAGYDHCFVIDRHSPGLLPFAWLEEPKTGRSMVVSTTLPAVQFYTGNFLSDIDGKCGSIYGKYAGLCLETQGYPDAPNKPLFPSLALEPGETWSHQSLFAFKP